MRNGLTRRAPRLLVAGLIAATLPGLVAASSSASASAATDRPLLAPSSTGLSVYTSPDPSTVASTAYVYSPVDLRSAPVLRVTEPSGRADRIRAAFSHDADPGQWWSAPLPGGRPGVRAVAAKARTEAGATVTGRSSYEITTSQVAPGPQWTSAGPGAIGGLLAASAERPSELYLASANAAQLYASDDGGASWRLERTLPVGGGYPTALLALPGRHGDRLVMSVNGGNGGYVDDATYTGKVLESDDGGAHWRDLVMPDNFVDRLLASPDGSTLFAVTRGGGIEITRDGGAHWRDVAVPWGSDAADAAALVGGDLYVATFTGLYVLRDAARATSVPTPAFTPPGARSTLMVGVAGDARTVYAASSQAGVFASSDAGRTWRSVYQPTGVVTMFDDLAGALYLEAGNVITVGTAGGTHWTSCAPPISGAEYIRALAVGPRTYLATVDAGIAVADRPGAPFRPLSGVPALDADSVSVARGRLVVGTTSDTYATTVTNAARAHPLPWEPLRPQTVSGTTIPLLATTPDGALSYKVRSGPRIGTYTIYSSADGGVTWSARSLFYGNADALLIDPADPADVYLSGDSSFGGASLAFSRDAGKTWTSTPLPGVAAALTGDPSDAARLWLGGPAGLWSSPDAGASFTALGAAAVTALADVVVGRLQRLLVGGAGLSYSDDGGRTLRPAGRPQLDLSMSSIAVSPQDPNTIFAGSAAFHDAGLLQGGHGVFESTDAGRSWFELDNGLDDRDVTSLAITPGGARLFAGTTQGGVFTIALPPRHR